MMEEDKNDKSEQIDDDKNDKSEQLEQMDSDSDDKEDGDFSLEESSMNEEGDLLREEFDYEKEIDLPPLEQLDNSFSKDEDQFMKREIDLSIKGENEEEILKSKFLLNSCGYKNDSFIDNESDDNIDLLKSNGYKDFYVNDQDLIEDK